MSNDYFFEIPVYRQPLEAHIEWMEEEKQKAIKKALGPYIDPSDDVLERVQKEVEETNAHREFVWYYNEVVGWLRLYVSENQVKADHYWVNYKRIPQRMAKKEFEWVGRAFATTIYDDMTNEDVFAQINDELEALRDKDPFDGYYIDLEPFHNLAPFVDWRKLINLSGGRSR